jgi:hypothetical protein
LLFIHKEASSAQFALAYQDCPLIFLKQPVLFRDLAQFKDLLDFTEQLALEHIPIT